MEYNISQSPTHLETKCEIIWNTDPDQVTVTFQILDSEWGSKYDIRNVDELNFRDNNVVVFEKLESHWKTSAE